MTTHDCKHEVDLAILAEKSTQTHNDTQKILKILTGNGDEGLTTKVALNKKAISRAWWFLSAISLALLGIAGYVLKKGIA